MRVTMRMSGHDGIAEALRKSRDAGEKVARAALDEFMPRVAADARAITPVDDVDGGQLRASVRPLRTTKTRDGLSGGVVAGGAPLKGQPGGAVYAIVQHEDLTLHHNDGQAKFLEIPFRSWLPRILKWIETDLAKVMRVGRG